ncbi:MAG TPA: PEP-CTERM sorting domain-containing protein, partial [Anaerohalosphaeraceae bacterium]|nr:PEP-CTERM sorting domain-containing protein [Anaerohalosphaeraceae bacterium]
EAELFYKWVDAGIWQIGNDATGWSDQTFNAKNWHRVVITADNANYFRVYLDGTLFLDAPGQGVDGRYSLYTDTFHLFSGDWNWDNEKWGYCSTIATWNRALSGTEVADLGGWIGGSATPTPLVLVPEPATLAMLTLGGLFALRRSRK